MKWSALSTTNPSLYIGYPTLEAWACVVHKDAPIYAMLLTEPGAHGQHGHRTESLIIVCAQPDDHTQVHYNRIMVGQLSFLGDQPFGSKHTWIMDQAEHAWGLVKDWFGEQAFEVREAVLATPVDYRFLSGRAEFLAFSQETGFSRKDLQTM